MLGRRSGRIVAMSNMCPVGITPGLPAILPQFFLIAPIKPGYGSIAALYPQPGYLLASKPSAAIFFKTINFPTAFR